MRDATSAPIDLPDGNDLALGVSDDDRPAPLPIIERDTVTYAFRGTAQPIATLPVDGEAR